MNQKSSPAPLTLRLCQTIINYKPSSNNETAPPWGAGGGGAAVGPYSEKRREGCLEKADFKLLLYSTGDCIWYLVITYNGKESEEKIYIYTYIRVYTYVRLCVYIYV